MEKVRKSEELGVGDEKERAICDRYFLPTLEGIYYVAVDLTWALSILSSTIANEYSLHPRTLPLSQNTMHLTTSSVLAWLFLEI